MRVLIPSALVIAASSGCQRTWLNPDLSASSMRKWLDRLITRCGAAEYCETEAEGREVNVPFELVFVFGTAHQATTVVAALYKLSQAVY